MSEITLILPEITLALTLSGLIASEIAYHGERVRLVSVVALLGLAAALAQTLVGFRFLGEIEFGGSLAVDGLSLFFKLFFILLSFLVVLVSIFTREIPEHQRTEYYTFLVAAALAMCFASSGGDFIVIFLAFQFLNILSYFMAGYSKHKVVSTEAAVKFLVFGIVSGVMFLYGAAVLFSITGTLNLYEIQTTLSGHSASYSSSLLVVVLLFLSLAFYIGAFPFYFWVPDVIEGVPTPTSVFLALGLPAAGFAVALRMLLVVFSPPPDGGFSWEFFEGGGFEWIVALASGVTMLAGALLAFRQQSAKRMLACLVVSNLGLMLLGLLVLNREGISALLFNMMVGLFSLVGIFCALSFLFDRVGSDRLGDFHGVLRRAIPECVCLILFLACFVGFPPFPGFLGRFLLIGAVVREKWHFLAVLASLATVLSVAAFARISFSLSGTSATPESVLAVSPDRRQRAFLISLLIPVILLSVFANPVIQWAERSLRFQLW